MLINMGRREDELYILDEYVRQQPQAHATSSKTSVSISIWHRCLRHPYQSKFNLFCKNNLSINAFVFLCNNSSLSKQPRLPFPQRSIRIPNPLNLFTWMLGGSFTHHPTRAITIF